MSKSTKGKGKQSKSYHAYANHEIRNDISIEFNAERIKNKDVMRITITDETSAKVAYFSVPFVNMSFSPEALNVIKQKG